MNAAIQGRSRYLDGLPAIELWGVSKGPSPKGEVNSRSEAHRARRRLKSDWRAGDKKAGISFKAFLRSIPEINAHGDAT